MDSASYCSSVHHTCTLSRLCMVSMGQEQHSNGMLGHKCILSLCSHKGPNLHLCKACVRLCRRYSRFQLNSCRMCHHKCTSKISNHGRDPKFYLEAHRHLNICCRYMCKRFRHSHRSLRRDKVYVRLRIRCSRLLEGSCRRPSRRRYTLRFSCLHRAYAAQYNYCSSPWVYSSMRALRNHMIMSLCHHKV